MHWQQLIKSALLGTERHPLDEQTVAALKKLGISTVGEPAEVLANAIAAFGQLRKAKIPVVEFEGDLPGATEKDALPALSRTSAHHLQLILEGKYPELLPEFLELLRKNRRMIPARLLPQLMATKDLKNSWPQIEPFIGNAGRWLLQQNPDWQQWAPLPFAEGKETEKLWETGGSAERVELLRRLRRENPERARSLLEQSWQQEIWTDRLAFLELLLDGLSLADEPFLESCLDDKRKEVRQLAADLLAQLPTSALGQRMYRRAMDSLGFDGRRLVVSIPDEVDEAARRDGIRPIAPEWPGGKKAGWLGQVVSRVPPEHWAHHFGMEAGEVAELFLESDWAETLAEALRLAAIRFKSAVWAEALLTALPGYPGLAVWQNGLEELAALVRPEFLLRFATALFDRNRDFLSASRQIMPLLQAVPGTWPEDLVYLLLQQFRRFALKHNWQPWEAPHLPQMLRLMACHAPLSMENVLQEDWEEVEYRNASLATAIADMREVLQFRKAVERGFEDLKN